METTQTTGSIEWTTRTTTSTIRQNVTCKCGLVSSRILIQTTKTTERSDRIGQVGRPQIKRVLENGRSEEPGKCACGREIHFRDVRGTFNAAKECNDKCMGSAGHVCECSCGGKNHGAAHAA